MLRVAPIHQFIQFGAHNNCDTLATALNGHRFALAIDYARICCAHGNHFLDVHLSNERRVALRAVSQHD